MTRKDYVMLAEALNNARAVIQIRDGDDKAQSGVRVACHVVADALANDNPRFDRDRFLKACGVAS